MALWHQKMLLAKINIAVDKALRMVPKAYAWVLLKLLTAWFIIY